MSTETAFKASFFQRFHSRVHTLLRQGLSPRSLAATLALGTLIGILPIVWGTSLLCVLTAGVLRLNQVAMQAVNYLVWPLQMALFLLFFRTGQWLMPTLAPGVDIQGIVGELHSDPLQAVAMLGGANLQALFGWLCLAPPAGLLLYAVLRGVLPRLIRTIPGSRKK